MSARLPTRAFSEVERTVRGAGSSALPASGQNADADATTGEERFAAGAGSWNAEPYMLASNLTITSSKQTGGELTALSTGARHAPELPKPVLRIPLLPPPTRSFEILQQFEGTVRTIAGEEFVVELRDLTRPELPPEEAALDLREISDGDLPLFGIGAVFYWTLGYAVTPHGQKSRVSELRFRRWPPWTKREIKAIDAEADELQNFFGGGADESASRTG